MYPISGHTLCSEVRPFRVSLQDMRKLSTVLIQILLTVSSRIKNIDISNLLYELNLEH